MPVRKSVGSNPTGVIIFCRIRFAIYECILNKIEVSSIGFVLINNIRTSYILCTYIIRIET